MYPSCEDEDEDALSRDLWTLLHAVLRQGQLIRRSPGLPTTHMAWPLHPSVQVGGRGAVCMGDDQPQYLPSGPSSISLLVLLALTGGPHAP
jgi:hypothetical protein